LMKKVLGYSIVIVIFGYLGYSLIENVIHMVQLCGWRNILYGFLSTVGIIALLMLGFYLIFKD